MNLTIFKLVNDLFFLYFKLQIKLSKINENKIKNKNY